MYKNTSSGDLKDTAEYIYTAMSYDRGINFQLDALSYIWSNTSFPYIIRMLFQMEIENKFEREFMYWNDLLIFIKIWASCCHGIW